MELITPPAATKEGERPTCGDLAVGSTSEGVSTKNISKVWGQVQPLLTVNDGCQARQRAVWRCPVVCCIG